MAIYKCCNPDCDNQLQPGGPISFLVTGQNIDTSFNLEISPEAKLSDRSEEIVANLATQMNTEDIELKTDTDLGGSLGNFSFETFQLTGLNKFSTTPIQQNITIRCQVCDSLCSYTHTKF